MAYPITRTKIVRPKRGQNLLVRNRLLVMLEDLLDYRLTLVAAPAGYGKTSLLVDLASRVRYPVCWLSIDPLDSDLPRFLSHLVAAVEECFPRFGGPSRSLLENQGAVALDFEQVLRTIINDLYDHIEEHFVLVLDDFHLVDDSPEITRFINRFVQDVDENCHLVVTSRTLLSLPDLPLMIGRSLVKGISFEELAFEPEEIRELYQIRFSQDLSREAAEEIAGETDGWITGLLLTAVTSRDGETEHSRAARAAGVGLYDYLAGQVLERQTPEMRDFLLRTSLLEEFDQKLCRKALGEPSGDKSWAALIQDLLQANLFIQRVENEGTWLRYQHLFQEFLQQHFWLTDPEGAEELLRSLVDVYRSLGWWEKAYAICMQLEEEDITVGFLLAACGPLMHQGRVGLLSRWLNSLSFDVIQTTPRLLAYQAVAASYAGNPAGGLGLLNRALEQQGEELAPELKALLLLRRSLCHRLLNHPKNGTADARESYQLTQKFSNQGTLHAEAERELGLNLWKEGHVTKANSYLNDSLTTYLKLGDQRNAAYVQMDLGVLYMALGQYGDARELYQQAYLIWEDLENIPQLIGLSNNLGVLEHLLGNFRDAYEWFARSLEFARQTSSLRYEAFTLTSLADLALDLGALSTALEYLDRAEQLASDLGEAYLLNYLRLSRAGFALRQNRLDEASARLEAYPLTDEGQGTSLLSGKYHFILARTAFQGADHSAARDHFEQARLVFEDLSSPVESATASLHLARLAAIKGDQTARDSALKGAAADIEVLGTVQPLVPHLPAELDFLDTLPGGGPFDKWLSRLLKAAENFQEERPSLIKDLGFRSSLGTGHQPPALVIKALGRIQILRYGEPLSTREWSKHKTVRELFFYLLSQPDGASREEICLVFWPDSEPDLLNKQFKNALYRLRRAVGKETILYHQPTRLYHFNRSLDYRYDVEVFQQAVAAAEELADGEEYLSALRRAAALYRHPFAPSLDGIWAEPVRYQLYLAYERSVLALARGELAGGRPVDALQALQSLLEDSPTQEAAWRLAMRAYQERGDRAGVERAYRSCREALARTLEVEPSQETISLYRALTA